jgi:hypothetical protein
LIIIFPAKKYNWFKKEKLRLVKRLLAIVLLLCVLLIIAVTTFWVGPGVYSNALSPYGTTTENQQSGEASGLFWLLEHFTDSNSLSAETSVADSAVTELAISLTENLNSDYEKMSAIYDWVTENIAYDLDKAKDVTAYGSGAKYLLENNRGVCHDYAELTLELLKTVGIEASYVKGEVTVSSGKTELHAWNNVIIGEQHYALDTTWGAGFILKDGSGFLQKPRRLYLTTPEELALLHSDPDYKQLREQEYSRLTSAAEPVVHIPAEEALLLQIINEDRWNINLPPFSSEIRLDDLARSHAVRLAEEVCAGEEFSLDPLSSELNRRAGDMNIKSAAIYGLIYWFNQPFANEELIGKIRAEQAENISSEKWESIVVSIVSKGELIVIVNIYLEYF